jgi:3-hydroxyisobutyrate dehydrogenase-like beta-hydroxyacid dehydrogenase
MRERKVSVRVGFLGFGEAGAVISKSLLANGLTNVVSYDCNYLHPTLGETIQRRAADAGVQLLPSNADLVEAADLIVSVVTAASALEAAEQASPHLRAERIFCDCNSVAPSTKTRIAQVIQRTGSRFVEAAIMAPVHADLHRMPVLMTGREAPQVASYFALFGMKIEVIDGPTGTAAAIKMCRSIVIKGLEALLLECMVTAGHFGCEEAVLHSLEASNPEFHWKELSEYMIGRVLEHGVRRAAEMREVAAMQREAGLSALMAAATAEVQDWRKRFPDNHIRTKAELLSVLQSPTHTHSL